MLIVLYFLLILRVGRCTDDLIFETKTVGVGDDVTLKCPRQTSDHTAALFWIRLVSGNFPEVLGGTFDFDYDSVNETPRVTAKQGPGTFLVLISKTQRSDTGGYYCVKVNNLHMIFLKATFLRVKGPEPDITAIIQDPPSDPLHPGDSVTLQCSVFTDSDNKTCPGDHSVFWFRAGSDETHPSVVYARGNSSDECEESREALAPQKCVYSFSKNVDSSDAGTYYCAVVTCGEILFGDGAKLDMEAFNMEDLKTVNTVLFLLCAALALSLIVITLLIYTMKKTFCGCCKAAGVLETNAATDQQRQQRDENSLVYSAPTFSRKKAGRAERRNRKTAEGETIYSDVANRI